jgi:hypothetical protein
MKATHEDLHRIITMCGNPNPDEACRNVIKECSRIIEMDEPPMDVRKK